MQINKNIYHLLIMACLIIPLTGLYGCSKPKHYFSPKNIITVSIPAQESILRAIADSDFDINILLPPGADPESFEPSWNTMKNLHVSKVWFTSGFLPFENAWHSKIIDNFPNLTIATLTPSQQHQENIHAEPHAWTSLTNLQLWAEKICETIIKIQPSNAHKYRQNLKIYKKRIAQTADSINIYLKKAHKKNILIWHPSLNHWAKEFNIVQYAIEEEGKEPTPARMAYIINQAKKGHVNLFIIEKEHSPSMALTLNEELHLPTFEISLMQGDILDNLLSLAREISK